MILEGRLHPLAILVYGWRGLRPVGIAGVVALLSSGRLLVVGVGLAAAVAVGVPLAVLAWRRFTYRVTGEALEVRSGVLTRSTRRVPLERVRGVDVSAPLVHRLVGLVSVRVDAAGGSASTLRLAAVRPQEAAALREAVLARDAGGVERPEEGEPPDLARVGLGTLAVAGATSARYLAVPVAALAAAANLLDDVPALEALFREAGARAPRDALALGAIVAGGLGIVAGVAALGAVLVDGGFRLRRARGRLSAERGLLARRSVSVDPRRVRALEVGDSPLWRLLRLASLRALVGGIAEGRGDARGRTVLLPAGRGGEAWRLARLLAPGAPTALTPHPRASGPRRLLRASGPPAVGAGLAAALGPAWLAVALGLAAIALVPVARDRHRNLGHRLEAGWLALREGSLARRHTLIEPGAVVTWTVRASPGQRRAGLCTLTVHLGRGAGSRRALDLGADQATRLLAAADPALLAPLLAEAPTRS